MRDQPSPEMQAMAELLRANGIFNGGTLDVAALRSGMNDGALPLPEGATRSDFERDGLKLTHIGSADARSDRGILYFHGGGYVLGSLDSHAELMARVASACRAPVLGLDYRLAPEHPYPAAVDDAVASYERLLDQGIAPEAIVLAGDSAGGGLVLACLLALKQAGKPLPAGAILFSPWTDLTASGASTDNRAAVDPMVSAALLAPMAAHYAGATDAGTPLISPLFGELNDLPPLLIQVGDHEILLDDSTRLAQRAEAADVDVTLEIYPGAFHVFQSMPQVPESAEALATAAAFFDRVMP
ncbi:MAG: alpha/beta hydrolase [Pseudomonadota bacterium]